jgi:hypothetical protein
VSGKLSRMEEFWRRKGRRMSGWEEVGEGRLR